MLISLPQLWLVEWEQDTPVDWIKGRVKISVMATDYDKKVPDYDKKVPDYDKKVPDYDKKVPEFGKKVPESGKVPESDKR